MLNSEADNKSVVCGMFTAGKKVNEHKHKYISHQQTFPCILHFFKTTYNKKNKIRRKGDHESHITYQKKMKWFYHT